MSTQGFIKLSEAEQGAGAASASHGGLSAWEAFYSSGEQEYEDNRGHTSSDWRFLEGRCFSAHEGLSPEWVYQRFINRAMQYFTEWHQPWYVQPVDKTGLQGLPLCVLVGAVVLSPILFPFVYGTALVLLTFGGFWTYRVIWAAADEEKDSHASDKSGLEKHWRIPSTILRSAWLVWLSVMPWLYLFKFGLERQGTVLLMACVCVCMSVAFRCTTRVLISAMSCKVEEAQQTLFDQPIFGKATKAVVEQLANHKDGMSFYPIYVAAEEDDVAHLPLSWTQWLIVHVVSVAHSFIPLMSLLSRRDEGDDDFEYVGYFWTLAPLLTSMLGLFQETRVFVTLAFENIEEYTDAVDEIFVFLYISASHSIKHRMKTAFVRTVTENDKWRKDHVGGDPTRWAVLDRPGLRFQGTAETGAPSQDLTQTNNSMLTQTGKFDELADLFACRAAFNFTRKEGIMLFRFMRKWVIQDIQAERFEVELCMDKLLVALGCVAALAAATWINREEPPLFVVIVRGLDIAVILYLIIKVLNLCVNANEHLFDDTCRMLLDWSDKVAIEGSQFEGESLRDPAIGWLYDVQSGGARPVQWDGDFNSVHDASDKFQKERRQQLQREDALRVLDTTIKIMKEVEQKQMFFGMEVTSALRNRFVTAAVSTAVAWAGKKLTALL